MNLVRRWVAGVLRAGARRVEAPGGGPLLYRAQPAPRPLPRSSQAALAHLQRNMGVHDAAMANLEAVRRRYRDQTAPRMIEAEGRRRTGRLTTPEGPDWRHRPSDAEVAPPAGVRVPRSGPSSS